MVVDVQETQHFTALLDAVLLPAGRQFASRSQWSVALAVELQGYNNCLPHLTGSPPVAKKMQSGSKRRGVQHHQATMLHHFALLHPCHDLATWYLTLGEICWHEESPTPKSPGTAILRDDES